MVKDTSTQFEFPEQSLLLRFLWPSKSRVCGELSKRRGQGWVAKLVGANSVSVVCVHAFMRVRACVTGFLPYLLNGRHSYHYYYVWKDAASVQGWLLFEGCVRTCYTYCPHSKNMASQGKWTKRSVLTALCAGTMSTKRCGFHFGEIRTATPEPKNDCKRHAVCVNMHR